MRAAHFEVVFCGIETPDAAALRSISKSHNLMVPIIDAIATLNRYGMEVVSGIIMDSIPTRLKRPRPSSISSSGHRSPC